MRRDFDALGRRAFDILVIGGGVHGAALAREAARRGYAVALVEALDFASGATSSSLKTIHGGLRHLARGHLRALRESARDRTAWLRLAPRLVRPLPFVIPTRGHGVRGREALGLGLLAADLLSRDLCRGLPPEHRIPRPRLLSAKEVVELVPGLGGEGRAGGVVWHDAQVESPERLVLALLHDAVAAGAVVLNHAAVERLVLSADARVTGATVRDGISGGRAEASATCVVNAGGAAADPLLAAAGIPRPPTPVLRAWNLVLGRACVLGAAVGGRAGGRFLFLVPWRGRAMVGTGYAAPDADAGAARRALLADAQRAFPWAGLAAGDVAFVHEGVVPGSGGAEGLLPVSRVVDHGERDGVRGLSSIVAAKFTTALGTARATVDALAAAPGSGRADSPVPLAPLPHAAPLEGTLEERTRFAVREEMACLLQDAVLRRLDLGTAGPPAPEDVDVVAATMAAELGWSEDRVRLERQALETFYAGRRLAGS